MSPKRLEWLVCLVVCCSLTGCTEPTERLNAPPQGQSDRPHQLQAFFTYMVDNEMMSDVSIADIHFVPHTTELNSLGTSRLSRMAAFLDIYGGTVRYATRSNDEELVDGRLTHLRDFLATTGIDLSRVDVTVAMAGADHTSAVDAIQAAKKARNWTQGQETLWFPSTAGELD